MDTNGQVSQLPVILASEELKNSLKGPRGSNTERKNFTWGGGTILMFLFSNTKESTQKLVSTPAQSETPTPLFR